MNIPIHTDAASLPDSDDTSASHASISPEFLNDFKELFKKEFKRELTDQEAFGKALDLLNLFEAIYRPIPVDAEDVYNKIRECYKDVSSSKT